jgi:hypothetical protein
MVLAGRPSPGEREFASEKGDKKTSKEGGPEKNSQRRTGHVIIIDKLVVPTP